MRAWDLTLPLDAERDQPLFLQLANGIAEHIRAGRLKPGDALPGTRELAARVGLNRNTVVSGYAELAAEGLVGTRVGGGTFVLDANPAATGVGQLSETPSYELAPAPAPLPARRVAPSGALLLSASTPDVRHFPARELARAFRRALSQRGRNLPGYADPCGHVRLRIPLAAMLARSRGIAAAPDNLMITRSIEQAIDLVARTLIAPGDVVAVENFGYAPAWNVLRLAGARLVPIALDRDGLDLDALESLLQQQRIRAVFLTPHHQYPTGAVMSPRRRARLADLALQHRFAILEDDYDHEFHYAGKPILPLAAGAARANAVYIGSLANLLAPGVGAGFVVAPPAVFERIYRLRAASDARSDAAMEIAIAELFEDGELLRHTRRMRRVYAARRDLLAAALRRQLGSALAFELPDGGTGLWARVDPAIDALAWETAGEREGVILQNSRAFHFTQRDAGFFRLGFSYLDEAELVEAVRRMARALTRVRTSQLAAVRAPPAETPAEATASPPRRRNAMAGSTR